MCMAGGLELDMQSTEHKRSSARLPCGSRCRTKPWSRPARWRCSISAAKALRACGSAWLLPFLRLFRSSLDCRAEKRDGGSASGLGCNGMACGRSGDTEQV